VLRKAPETDVRYRVHAPSVTGGTQVVTLKQERPSLTSDIDEALDLEIWDTTEALSVPERPLPGPASAVNGKTQASDTPSVPPLGGATFLGLTPNPPIVAQASSDVPPRRGDASRPAESAGVALSVPPPAEHSDLWRSADARLPGSRGALAPGGQFGVYRVGACIGEGGMARIYQAEHAGLRRQVALKVLLDASTRAPEGRERFLREARIAAAIKHPNVVNIFDVGVHDDTAFLVMELLTGTDLEQLIEERGALDEATIVDIMIPVLAGLTAVHDAGVVHRDLKPGNVFLAQGRYDEVDPKLLDFGICKAPGPEQLRLTANGMLIGTPFYMSPEGLRGEEMTPSSDQYSLGVVMYECATGTNPFGATTFAEIFRLIGAGQYPLPSSIRPQISKRLERIILRAMNLDPAQRFKDLREMGRELLLLAGQRTRITWSLSFGEIERPKASGTQTWKVPQGSSPPAAPPDEPRGRKRALFALPLLLLAAAAVLGSSGVFSSRAREEPRLPRPSAAPVAVAPAPAALNEPAAADVVVTPRPLEAPAQSRPATPKAATPPHRVWARRQPMAVGAAPDGDESDPDWAIPAGTTTAAQVRPAQARTQIGVGANGAPIFD
jgi:eukaryotic-like serine/threonine-protein kinase